ncbi:prolyl oligopeptidase family serine peptidase [Psychrobium sp. 1_MG-2023]|uniref:S9 family peptidase n=1 Tax=Psychrobium sp. 1_MG-2023 TaxID=3062624 RepID=UPI00351DFDF2
MKASAVISCLGLTAAVSAKGFDVETLTKLNSVHSASVSPNGEFLIYGHKKVNKDTKVSNLYLRNLNDIKQPIKQLTAHKTTEHDVVWSNDNKTIYFISARSGSAQVWSLALDGGEARQVTDLPIPVNGIKLSPDNKKIALALTVFPECKTIQCTADKKKTLSEKPNQGREYTQLMVRHWDTWKDHSYNHVFVADLTNNQAKNLVDIHKGLKTDVPAKPFSGMEEVSFTPDSASIVYSAKLGDHTQSWHTNYDLWQVPVTGGKASNLTAANTAWDSQPVFSNDGRYMAYAAMSKPAAESDRFAIMLKDLVTGNVKEVAPLWDRSVRSIKFAPDSRNLYVTAQDLGQVSVFAINIQFGDVKTLHNEGSSSIIGVSGDNVIISKKDLSSPGDLYSLSNDGTSLETLTNVNKDVLADVDFGEYSQFTFKGWNDETVHGYWVKPADFKQGEKYPIAFLIHGGPQGSFGNSFSTRWNPQLWAGAGYGVVMIDFHGSTGYGQQFTDSINQDWGGKPLEDLQKGLAAVTKQQPWLDGDNACALGGSYGGYMVNWIAGNWSKQFKCLVNHAGLFDMRMFYNVTEELWFPEQDFGGSYLNVKENYEKFNPANFVQNWQTPMLVIHGEKDFRVPYGQGLAAFTVLQRKGIDSKLLMFPSENHWILTNDNKKQWYKNVLDWMDKYTAK